MENKNDDDNNNDIYFIIEKEINLGNYIENKLGPTNYELNGIVFFHKIRNKYVSLCCSPVDYKWYFYDDEKVELINYDDFMEKEYENKLYYQPCILLYKNVKN